MKHLKKGRKFSRTAGQRKAMLKNILGSFMLKEKITTTEAKAKEIKIIFEKTVGRIKKVFAKDGKIDVSALRGVKADLPQNINSAILKKIAERYKGRSGGYARIIKKGARKSDGAKIAVIEMIEK